MYASDESLMPLSREKAKHLGSISGTKKLSVHFLGETISAKKDSNTLFIQEKGLYQVDCREPISHRVIFFR
jgi:hypothetical protein